MDAEGQGGNAERRELKQEYSQICGKVFMMLNDKTPSDTECLCEHNQSLVLVALSSKMLWDTKHILLFCCVISTQQFGIVSAITSTFVYRI